ncbi:hypothetical protein D3C72_1759090 [compost metagenome]
MASLIADDIGLFQGARKGSDAITYLWQWDHAGKPIEERPETGYLLDAQAFYDKNAGIGRNQIKFEHHVGIGKQPEAKPEPMRVHVDDIFQWGAK